MLPAIKQSMGPVEWALLTGLAAIWGGSFFFFAVIVHHLPVFTIVLLRVAIAAAALWAMVLALGVPVPRSALVWRNFLIMGLLNNAIPFSLIVFGQTRIASGLAAVINGAMPFFTVLVANAFTADEKFKANRLAGALLGLGGLGLMIGLDAATALGSDLLGQFACLAAAIAYAFGSVFGRRFAGTPPLVTAAGQLTGSTLLMAPVVLLLNQPWALSSPPAHVWAAIFGLALLCTASAYVLYFEILKRAGANNIALVTFLAPVSAIILGVLFLGENFKPQQALGMAAIGLGLAVIDGRLVSRLWPR